MNIRVKLLLSILLAAPLFSAACGGQTSPPTKTQSKSCASNADCKTPNTVCVKSNSTSKCVPTCTDKSQCSAPNPYCSATITTIDGTYAKTCASTQPNTPKVCTNDADCKDPNLICMNFGPGPHLCAQKCSDFHDCNDPAAPTCVLPALPITTASGKTPTQKICYKSHSLQENEICAQDIDCDESQHLVCATLLADNDSEPTRCRSKACDSDSDCNKNEKCLTDYLYKTLDGQHPKLCLSVNSVKPRFTSTINTLEIGGRNQVPLTAETRKSICHNSEQCFNYSSSEPNKHMLCIKDEVSNELSRYNCKQACETNADCGDPNLKCLKIKSTEVSGKKVKLCWPTIIFCTDNGDCPTSLPFCQKNIRLPHSSDHVNVCAQKCDAVHPYAHASQCPVNNSCQLVFNPTANVCDMAGLPYQVLKRPNKCSKNPLPVACDDDLYQVLFDAGNTSHLKSTFKPTTDKNPKLGDSSSTYLTCDFSSGLCSATFMLGKKGGTGGIYIDFNANKILDINDQDAYNTNTDWTVGFKHWSVITNGGNFPGNISLAIIKGDSSKFNDFSLADAETLSDSDFSTENLVDASCNYIEYQTGGPAPVYALGVQTNRKTMSLYPDFAINALPPSPWPIPGSFYTYQINGHYPQIPKDLFLVLKDCTKPGWYAKMRVSSISGYDSNDMQTYKISYKVLN